MHFFPILIDEFLVNVKSYLQFFKIFYDCCFLHCNCIRRIDGARVALPEDETFDQVLKQERSRVRIGYATDVW